VEKLVAIIMAGGAGERLQPLTRERSKAAVPFGGKFRLIDFTLSNCVNSGIRRIFVLTQYRSSSLNIHIQEGWSISSSRLGEFIYSMPAQQKLGADWYRGTADAVRQNLDLLHRGDFQDILILSGDHVYKMNYLQLLNYHRAKNAGSTISATRVRKEMAAEKLGVLEADENSRMVGFEEKPEQPKTIVGAPDYTYASMGVYMFKVEALVEALREEGNDFGREIIPSMLKKGASIFVYDYEKENKIEDFVFEVKDGSRSKILVDKTSDSSYWVDVGTIDSYYEASMDLVGVLPQFNLYGERWLLRTHQRTLPPGKCVLGGEILESIMCDGCIISGGRVWRSILSPGVVIERGASVDESIIFDDVTIEPGARIRRAIIDKEVEIRAGVSIGYDPEADRRRGFTISESGIVVLPRGTEVKPLL
jgi:glucose-1-phosphate adenylyltransferase